MANYDVQSLLDDSTSSLLGDRDIAQEAGLLDSVKDPDGILAAIALLAPSLLGAKLMAAGKAVGGAAAGVGGRAASVTGKVGRVAGKTAKTAGGVVSKMGKSIWNRPLTWLGGIGGAAALAPYAIENFDIYDKLGFTKRRRERKIETAKALNKVETAADLEKLRQADVFENRRYERDRKERLGEKLLSLAGQEHQMRYDAGSAFLDRYQAAKQMELQSLGQLMGLL